MGLRVDCLEETKDEIDDDPYGASLTSSLVFSLELLLRMKIKLTIHNLILFATLFSICYEQVCHIYAKCRGFHKPFQADNTFAAPCSFVAEHEVVSEPFIGQRFGGFAFVGAWKGQTDLSM